MLEEQIPKPVASAERAVGILAKSSTYNDISSIINDGSQHGNHLLSRIGIISINKNVDVCFYFPECLAHGKSLATLFFSDN